MVKNNLNLEKLSLQKCTLITSDGFHYLGEKLRNLKYLNLNWCTNVNNENIKLITMKNNKIRQLHLQGFKGMGIGENLKGLK